MWNDAVNGLWDSIAQVTAIRAAEVHDQTIRFPIPLGSAFRIEGGESPLFLTASHVLEIRDLPFEPLEGEIVYEEDGETRAFADVTTERESLAVISKTGKLAEGNITPVSAGVEVRHRNPDRDLALLASSPSGSDLKPVTFAGDDWVQPGVPTATLGYPLPDDPELNPSGGATLTIKRRFAGGWMSGLQDQEAPSGEEFTHYEVDIKAYPGVSGAPLFNTNGQVIGLMRRTLLHGSSAVYGYAVRNVEIFATLENWGVDIPH